MHGTCFLEEKFRAKNGMENVNWQT